MRAAARIAGGSQHSPSVTSNLTPRVILRFTQVRATADPSIRPSREPPSCLNDDRHVYVAFLAQYVDGYILIVAAKTEVEEGSSHSHILDLQPVQIVG